MFDGLGTTGGEDIDRIINNNANRICYYKLIYKNKSFYNFCFRCIDLCS